MCLVSPRRRRLRTHSLGALSLPSRGRPLLITAVSPALPRRKRDSALPAHPPAPPTPAPTQCASAYFRSWFGHFIPKLPPPPQRSLCAGAARLSALPSPRGRGAGVRFCPTAPREASHRVPPTHHARTVSPPCCLTLRWGSRPSPRERSPAARCSTP